MEFTVNLDGTPQTVLMKDAPTDVTFSKTSITETAELKGAELELRDAQGILIDSWTTDGATQHRITAKLIAGATYTLVEKTAPNGYVLAESVSFAVKMDGTPQLVAMKDAPTDVTFSKMDVTGLKELPGAKLTIFGADNSAVETWVSTAEAHRIVAKLTAGATYTLVEETSPAGYTVAESIRFTVGTDGAPQTVNMRDAVTTITVSKRAKGSSEELKGATLAIVDPKGNVVIKWKTTDEAKTIEGLLNVGTTYTLKELDAPAGYAVAASIQFQVNPDGSGKTVIMHDKRVADPALPKTGDRSDLTLWIAILGASILLLIAVALVAGKRRRTKD